MVRCDLSLGNARRTIENSVCQSCPDIYPVLVQSYLVRWLCWIMQMEGQISNKRKDAQQGNTFKKLSFVVLILSPQFYLRKLYLSVLVFVSEVCQHLYLSCPIELVKPCGQGTSGRHRCKNGQKAGGRDHQRRTSSEKTLFFSKLFAL